jgi:methylmalonyl-CoA mutase cobalamin-binding subunit
MRDAEQDSHAMGISSQSGAHEKIQIDEALRENNKPKKRCAGRKEKSQNTST